MTKKGLAIKSGAKVYDFCAPTERSNFREKIIRFADLKSGEKVLDVGCGTGSLTIIAKKKVGEKGEVTGLDLSSQMIERAKQKAEKYDLNITFCEGSIDNLEFSDSCFDVVISSWMFHHLPINIKKDGLKEIHRVLKNDGRFLFFDFCKPHYIIGYIIVPLFIWTNYLREHILGRIPKYFEDAGFNNIDLKKKGIFTEIYLMEKI